MVHIIGKDLRNIKEIKKQFKNLLKNCEKTLKRYLDTKNELKIQKISTAKNCIISFIYKVLQRLIKEKKMKLCPLPK